MATNLMVPPDDGSRNAVTVNGRTYSSVPGASIPVPTFDQPVLQANGWYVIGPAPTAANGLAPQISAIPGLAGMLANGGWQVLTDRPHCIGNSAGTLTLSSTKAGATVCLTNRTRHRAMFAATHIVLVYANWSKLNGLVEAAGKNPVRFKASVQKFGSSFTDETQVTVPVTFQGQRFGLCAHGGLLFSDPIAFDVAANEIFFIRTAQYVAGPGYFLTCDMSTAGGTGAGALGNGEGSIAGDYVDSGTIGSSLDAYAPTGGPVAVLGFSARPQKSCALIGDSIAARYHDWGYAYNAGGGYLFRLMRNFTTQIITPALEQNTIGNFPFVHMAQGGQTSAMFASRGYSSKTLRTAELCSTWIYEYSSNDILTGATLAAVQQSLLTVAAMAAARGKNLLVCTLLPWTSSSDYYTTVSGQTVTAYESVRTAYNSWLRDSSPTGFVGQAKALYPNGSFGVLDAAATIEVNSAGVLTLNGGFWPAALQASIISSTATGTPTASGFADSSQNLTQDQYKGYAVRFTSGAASGQTGIIAYHSSNFFTFGSILNNAPVAGDPYVLFNPYVYSPVLGTMGVHPTALGHMTVANGLIAAGALSKVI